MTITELQNFLLCSLAINYAVLSLWFGVYCCAHEWLYRLHSRWFKLSPEAFDSLHYASMAIYKIGVMLFNLVPWLALWILY